MSDSTATTKPQSPASACQRMLDGLRREWQQNLNAEAHLYANPPREEDREIHRRGVELMEHFLRHLDLLEQSI